ncbi:hypothetical protein EXS57_01365 [Candidatus Kaiserbacteria bacterium]|nr:hypothetical protein [Candidatus Kaiserbacteria bacterium]
MSDRTRFAPAGAMQEPVIWQESPDLRKSWPKASYLSDEEYGKSMAAFPRVCSDILALEPESKSFYLVERIHHSAIGRWGFGGGQRRGQTPREAAVTNLARETGIQLTENELVFLFATEMYWQRRNPEPQELGEQCRNLTYCFVPTAEELAGIKLDAGEYDLEHGIKLYSRSDIAQIPDGTRELLLMYWKAAFGG